MLTWAHKGVVTRVYILSCLNKLGVYRAHSRFYEVRFGSRFYDGLVHRNERFDEDGGAADLSLVVVNNVGDFAENGTGQFGGFGHICFEGLKEKEMG